MSYETTIPNATPYTKPQDHLILDPLPQQHFLRTIELSYDFWTRLFTLEQQIETTLKHGSKIE